jgi:hypothetical protein
MAEVESRLQFVAIHTAKIRAQANNDQRVWHARARRRTQQEGLARSACLR